MIWRITITGDGTTKAYIAQAATMPAAIAKALRKAFPGKTASNPLTIMVERAVEGLLPDYDTATDEG